jgi:plastocyanin
MNADSTKQQAPDATKDSPILVDILAGSFRPREVTIRAGQSVRWINRDSAVHIITSNPGASGCQPESPEDFLSYDLHTNGVFEYQFTNPGAYHYHCVKGGCGMSGSVTVI